MRNNTASHRTSLQDMKTHYTIVHYTGTHTLNSSLLICLTVKKHTSEKKVSCPAAILKIPHASTAAATAADLSLSVVY